MIRIKVCGITSANDAISVVRAGADAIGLNFYSQSKRCIDRALACEIARAVPETISKVGVFVNASPAEITSITRDVPLDYIQLHGDESPDTIGALNTLPVIRAWRVADQRSLNDLFQYLESCGQLRAEPAALLIDAYLAGQYGGTGDTAPWDLLVRRPGPLEHKSLILAGGLTPANVSHAIHTVRPDGVDVASGVEEQPGRKSEHLVRDFVEQAVAAFAAVTAG